MRLSEQLSTAQRYAFPKKKKLELPSRCRMCGMEDAFISQLEAIVGAENVLRDEPLAAHTTFRVGGPVELFVIPQSLDQVVEVVAACRAAEVPTHIVGHGSNLLVCDGGLSGVAVLISNNVSDVEVRDDGVIYAQAGASNAKVAAEACRAHLTGYEFAAGIPGTIGGAAIMNAGAYDGEFTNVAVSVTCLDPEGAVVEVGHDEADWGYRHSMMEEAGYIVLAATLQLQPGDPEAIRARMEELARRRMDKQPLDLPSAGSTFKRPEGHYAGKLIQDAGLMGYGVGGAQVSTKHAGFVVNVGGATASDVLQVIDDVRRKVFEDSGIMLEPEVRIWGFEER